ncbi:MAG TPA: ABC transporter ATP-binding protein [Puia sp.]|nr:ABC transporter ATP-binding protein [Puia sp.]
MNYNLNDIAATQAKSTTLRSLRKLLELVREERKNLSLAFAAILTNSGLNLLGPFLIGFTIDHYVAHKDYHGVLFFSGILLVMYMFAFLANYIQTNTMGGVGQRMLFKLRNTIFSRLQLLPVDFFNQNKAGDLISRVSNDTDKVNQFFSQSLMQFIGSIMTMIGAGIFLLAINFRLGLAALVPGMFIYLFTRLSSARIKRKNAASMKSTGALSSEIQEGLGNFKVIIAFNRRDYFRQRFEEINRENYKKAVDAGVANTILIPVYGFFSSMAQLIVLTLGIFMISRGEFSIGLLVSYLAYATNFYNPLRQLAALWANFQAAMAGWDRISVIINLDSNLPVIKPVQESASEDLLEFKQVHFGYPGGKEILHHVNFRLEPGKTYAFVGPTGGGKTTTASLIARLYDPVSGSVLLHGKDIRGYSPEERTERIGFILQEPFLFTGTVRENIIYGNPRYKDLSDEELEKIIHEEGLERLLAIFENGLDTAVSPGGESISLGQKQLIAFMRAILRNPELLILDEATANIDTLTEQILEDMLRQLPRQTTRVIIAHRLNTIRNADEIFFVNAGQITRAGSFEHAVKMLLEERSSS